jgi:tetratricopeptide (TPR) repeat protein
MHRYILAVTATLLVVIVIAVASYSSLHRSSSETDYLVARDRGAEYLSLHLYGAALKEFEQAIKLRPGEADPLIGMASTYIRLGDAAKAVQEADRATKVEGRSADAWIMLGRAQWQQRNFAEAEKAAVQVRELDPGDPNASELLLHVYFDQDQTKNFEAELGKTANPSPAIQDLAIQFYIRQGQFARAYDLRTRYDRAPLDRSILEAELAFKREPGRTELVSQRFHQLVRAGRFQEAIELSDGDRFRALQRSVSVTQFDLGKASWSVGRKDDAIRAYRLSSSALVNKLPAEIALAIITGDVSHWREAFRAERPIQDLFILAQLEALLPKADPLTRAFAYRYAGLFNSYFYNRSAEEALKVLNENPQDYDALITIANAYQHVGRLDDASRYLQQARDAHPRQAEPVSRLANLALASNSQDTQRVFDLMSEAVKMEPRNPGYLYNLGWLYDQVGDKGKSTDLYRRAIEASPLSFEAMNNLALTYGEAGEPDRALSLLENAIKSDPDNEVAYFNLATYHGRRRDWRSALQNYDHVLALNPVNAAASVEKGRIYMELGRIDSAIESLNTALSINPHSFDAYTLLASAYEKLNKPNESKAANDEAQRVQANLKK